MDLIQFAWIAWVVLVLVCVLSELLSLDLIFLMMGIGSLAGLGAAALLWPWWAQILVAAAVSVLLIWLLRPPLLRGLRRRSTRRESALGNLSNGNGSNGDQTGVR